MIEAIRGFVLKSAAFNVRLFYYADHGVQVNGKNYLVPIDADVQAEDEIAAKCADVVEMLERLGRIRTGMNLVILDACRNNPFSGAEIASRLTPPCARSRQRRASTPISLSRTRLSCVAIGMAQDYNSLHLHTARS